MTEVVLRVGRRWLPRGWRDFGKQLAIWFGFLLAYQIARGVADRNPTQAFENGLSVIGVEERLVGLVELSFQELTEQSRTLAVAVSWTYWLSEFAVLGGALLWVYLRRNAHFYRFRNWVLLTNVIGLVGYMLAPTAPPRMFPTFGFIDVEALHAGMNHGGSFSLAANPYAAMPSLHAADSLIVGISLALIVRARWAKVLWLLWPAWVGFTVMASANHFWLDCVAGAAVAGIAATWIFRRQLGRRLRRFRAAPA